MSLLEMKWRSSNKKNMIISFYSYQDIIICTLTGILFF